MSYADVAGQGPKQSPLEARAPSLPEVSRTDDSTHSLVDVDSPHISSVPSDFDQQSVKTDTQASRIEREEEARSLRHEIERNAKSGKEKSKNKASKAKAKMQENPESVIRIANTITGAIAAAALGYGAYQKHLKGELTWKVVGLWGGLAAAFGIGDYYAGQYLLRRYEERE